MIGLDLDRLGKYLGERELSGQIITGGRSNLTYLVFTGHHDMIVRRPPLGHVLATAHDMSREYRIITALHGTGVPVPQTYSLCTDPDVIGAPFYVMQYVPGHVYRTSEQAAALGLRRLETVATSLMKVLATLHAIDPGEVGLADFGKPDGYLRRQLVRWQKQLDSSRSRDLPGIDELHSRLVATAPVSTRSGIVHGDYRLDNAVIGDDDQVVAVLDWEMATLGDQLTDLGLMLMYWELMVSGEGMFGAAPPGARFPTSSRLVEAYREFSGTDLSDLNWYVAFANYKLAVIAEGIHYRFQVGQTVGDGFEAVGQAVPQLVGRGQQLLGER